MKEVNDRIKSFGIRNRILIFAILVTLAPTLGLGWVFHNQTRKLLKKNAKMELHYLINQAQQLAGLWCKKSSLNLRIFSNSFVISENLEYFAKAGQGSGNSASKERTTAIAALLKYLEMIQTQCKEYKSLHIFDNSGNLVVKSPAFSNTIITNTFPGKWQERLKHDHILIKELDCNIGLDETIIMIAAPIFSDKRKFLGMLAAELSIKKLIDVITPTTQAQSIQLSLVNKDGVSLFPKPTDFNSSITVHKMSKECSIYINTHGTKVVGIYAPLSPLSWGIVIEKNYNQVFADILLRLKNITLSMVALLLTIVGIAAFFVSYSILSPLKLLTNGAMRVAKGDFNVKLPVKKQDELGLAISIFNDMVEKVYKYNAQLEKLSTADSLTGLFNRRHLMDVLDMHIKRYNRNQVSFSILMADLDFFKKINDHYGHIAGDAVLVEIGKIFSTILRSIDAAGRYGGEEFLIILDNTRERQAEQTAERIRKAVEQSEIIMDEKRIKVTVSIGVATIDHIKDTKDNNLINRADKALYQAKQNGRNCVALSTT
ncbi:MAG: diguanylate cyclase [Thermodesulfobacteriota bacterium]